MRPFDLRLLRRLAAAFLVALLAGCATGFPGSGPYGGYPDSRYPDRGYAGSEVTGSVDGFDPSTGRLWVASDGYGRYGSRVEVQLDRSTRTYYGGREVDASGLERGDVVRVLVDDDGRQLRARTIEVLRNVREGGASPGYGGGYGAPAALEGAVRRVDLGRGLIEITRGGYSGGIERVYFDSRTRFDYRGQPVRPEQLESGDLVRIDGRRSQDGWYADAVWVTVDARSR